MSSRKILYGFLSVISVTLIIGVYFVGSYLWHLQHLKDSFADQSIQTQFLSYTTQLNPELQLHVATLHKEEIFERTSAVSYFWGHLKLPDVIVQMSVPVQYPYYLKLNSSWNYELRDKRVIIRIPDVTPGEPAPDISQFKISVQKGSFLRNEKSVVSALQADLTTMLRMRAKDSVPILRETAREQAKNFFTQFLSSQFSLSDEYAVEVWFNDESDKIN